MYLVIISYPSGQNRQKSSLILCAELTKNAHLQTAFFGNFAHWDFLKSSL